MEEMYTSLNRTITKLTNTAKAAAEQVMISIIISVIVIRALEV